MEVDLLGCVVVLPDRNVLVAFARLQGHTDFETILAWVVSAREDRRDSMESTSNTDALLGLGGESRALGEILRYAKDARRIIEGTA